MRRFRFLVLGLVSFVAAIFGALLVPGTWVNRVFSTLVCGIFSFNSMVCTANWGQSSQRVVAATPPAVEKTIFNGFTDLLAQRDPSEFGDPQPSAPSPQQSNPQAPPFPQDPGPNFPVRPEFNNPGSSQPNQSQFNQNRVSGERFAVASQLRQISPGLYEMVLRNSEGCQIIRRIRMSGNSSFYESIEYSVPNNNSCEGKSYKLKFSEDGNQISAENSHNEKFFIKIINSSLMNITYTDPEGGEWNFESQQVSESSHIPYWENGQMSQYKLSLFSQNKGFSETRIKTNNNFLISQQNLLADLGDSFVLDINCDICNKAVNKIFEKFGQASDLDTVLTTPGDIVHATTKWRVNLTRSPIYNAVTAIDTVKPTVKAAKEASILSFLTNIVKNAVTSALNCNPSSGACAKLAQLRQPQQQAQKPSPVRPCEPTQKQTTWILRLPNFQIRNGLCSITGYSEIPVTQNGQSLSATTGWNQQNQTGLRSGTTNLTGTITESGDAQMRITAPAIGLTLEFQQSGKVFNQVRNELTAIRGSAVAQGCSNAISGSFEMRKQSTQEIASNSNCPQPQLPSRMPQDGEACDPKTFPPPDPNAICPSICWDGRVVGTMCRNTH